MATIKERKQAIQKEWTILKQAKDQKVNEVNKISQRMIELEGQDKLLTEMEKDEQTPLTPVPTEGIKKEGPKQNSKSVKVQDAPSS